MYWHLVFSVIFLHSSRINGQRRSLVNYHHQVSTVEPEPLSENPLSSSINSIQTGREELTAFYRGDSGSGGSYRRGNHKTTTPPYFKELFPKGDNGDTGKSPPLSSSSKSSHNDGRPQESQITQLPSENKTPGDTITFKDKRSTSMESSFSTIRPDITSDSGRNSQTKGTAKEGMDINKSIASREQDRRPNAQESRRHTTTPPSNTKFNSSVRDNAEKHREEHSEKSHSERPNKERRPAPSTENTRGHRTATRSTSEKGQILTQPTPRNPTGQRYDRTDQPSISSGSQDGKVPDRHLDTRDLTKNIEEKKKDFDIESDLGSKVYSSEIEDRSKPGDDQRNSSDSSKPTYALGEEGKPSETSRNPDGYRDQLTGGEKGDMNGKVGSDIEKSLGGGERKSYAERSYPRDEEERSPGHHARESDRGYTRRHRDRYDERSYDERPAKTNQPRKGQERTSTYDSRDRTAGRTSRPRDRGYDEEYRDDIYSSRDAVKSSDNVSTDRTRAGRPSYTGSGDDVVDRDRYPGDGTRSYRDYSGDRRYRDEHGTTDRDNRRRYRDEDNRKYSDESSRGTSYYDDYEETDTYRDDYAGRYGKDGETRRFRDDVTLRYPGTGSRRYDEEEVRRPEDRDRPVRRYKDDEDYKYNNTRRYRDSYDVYRDDTRRGSGESVSSHRYDERDGTRSTRYDEEDYKASRSYSTRDSDSRYVRRDHEDTSRQRDATRKYVIDDVTRYRGDDDDKFRDEPRTYSGSSPRDSYDQKRRSYEDGSTYIGTRTYQESSETDSRRDYDDVNRRTSSRRTHVDGNYSSYPYPEDEYYNNRTSTGYSDRYDRSDRTTRRPDGDYSGFVSSEGDDRKYAPRSSDERHRDKDRTYADIPASRKRTDTDGTHSDTRRVYDDDRWSDRDQVDSYDERTYRDRDADEYIRSSRGRDYDNPIYKDSDDEIDPRNYRVREDADVNDRYRGDGTVRDRTTNDEIKTSRPASGRNRDKSYSDRTHEERYGDRSSEGTYRYREEDDRYRYVPSEGRKPEYRDSERSNRGTERFRDDYDDRDSSIPRNTDERHRSGSKSTRKEDRLAGDRTDYEDKVPDPERSSKSDKPDTSLRSDTKSEFSDRRRDESIQKGERSSYDEESRRDRRRPHPRDLQPAGIPPKTRSSEDRPDSLDTSKGDFGRGRRTFFNEEDKTDSDREERAKSSREDRLSRADGNEELSYTRNEKDRGSAYDARDSRQNGRSNTAANSEGRAYSSRRENTDTSRHRTNDEIPVSRMPSDLLLASDDTVYSDRKDDVANPTASKTDQGSQRRYSTSFNERSSRRQLPVVREPDMDRPPRKEESEDSALPDYRGGYRHTKSRDDFDSQGDDRIFTARDEYNPRGGKSSKGLDADRGETLKGDYGSPGSGTPTRNKQERIPEDSERQSKEEYYTPVRDKDLSRDGKLIDDSPERRDSDRRDKVARDRGNTGRDERGIFENEEYHRSSSQEELKFVGENSTRDHSNEDARSNKENDYSTLSVVSQGPPGGRSQGSTISRSATPIPHFQDKELISRNVSSKNISDKFSGSAIYREKRFQYDDRFNTNNASRGIAVDELSKRPLTTKEVIDAAYRHSEDTEKQREIFYPVYVPGSGNMTSPDIIRPSERRGITTPTKKKKKK